MYGYTPSTPYAYEPIRTWDIIQNGASAPLCGQCHREVAVMTVDGDSIFACPSCSVSARMRTYVANNYLSTHKKVTFPIQR